MKRPAAPPVAGAPWMTGLYDDQGVLRCAGRDAADCLAYAELFGLAADRYSLAALEAPRPLQWAPRGNATKPQRLSAVAGGSGQG